MRFKMSGSSFIPVLLVLLAFAALPEQPLAGGDQVKYTFDELQFASRNTRVRVITDNVEAWNARWYVLQNARESIDTTYFILEHDVFGDAFIGLLLKKVREGVRVRLMIDARGSGFFASRFTGGQDYLQELVEAGAEVKVFNPMLSGLPDLPCGLKYFISSNHDKIIVVDGRYTITGGRNIAVCNFADPADFPGANLDTDVVMEGEFISRAITVAFDEEFASLDNYTVKQDLLGNWFSKCDHMLSAEAAMDAWMRGGKLYEPTGDFTFDPSIYNDELKKYPASTTFEGYRLFKGDRALPVKIIDKHSIAGDRNDITDSIVKLIDASEKEILMQNPYVVLTEKARAALKRASDRGVRIVLNTNSPVSSNSILTQAFFVREWLDLQVAMPNLEVWAYLPKRLIHAKVFVFDRKVTVIGTYNMDPMSEQINSEVVACINSGSFSMRTALRIERDLEESRRYTIDLSKDGRVPVELFGPSSIAKGRLKLIIDFLSSIKWLRPFV